MTDLALQETLYTNETTPTKEFTTKEGEDFTAEKESDPVYSVA